MNMKNILGIGVILNLIIIGCNDKRESVAAHTGHHATSAGNYADSVNAGIIPVDTLKGSPARTAMTFIGNIHVHIEYSSPGVRGRTIWGGLVAYDQVWVTGAHQATSIDFSRDVQVGDQTIPKGKYAFFTVPGKTRWELILNKNWDQHLADEYQAQDDLVRITVEPEILTEAVQRLTYTIEKVSDKEGVIVMRWEKIRVEFPFKTL